MANGASTIEGRIILSATNQTGPMFAEIQAELQSLNKSLGELVVPRLDTTALEQQLRLIEEVGSALSTMHRQAGTEIQSVQSLYDEFIQGFAQGMQDELKALGPAFSGTFGEMVKTLQGMDLSKDLFEGFAEGITDELRKQTPEVQRAFENLIRRVDVGRGMSEGLRDFEDEFTTTLDTVETRLESAATSGKSMFREMAEAGVEIGAQVTAGMTAAAYATNKFREAEVKRTREKLLFNRSQYSYGGTFEDLEADAKKVQDRLGLAKSLTEAWRTGFTAFGLKGPRLEKLVVAGANLAGGTLDPNDTSNDVIRQALASRGGLNALIRMIEGASGGLDIGQLSGMGQGHRQHAIRNLEQDYERDRLGTIEKLFAISDKLLGELQTSAGTEMGMAEAMEDAGGELDNLNEAMAKLTRTIGQYLDPTVQDAYTFMLGCIQ